ncbi:hypothetical protein [uncultured Microbacterium sp.]|uniref:hypothetical protein n=1 Tax=uncultured Microbacterium sp. TaxID=191216 RepID=UPI0025E9982A|nr:hypothetical protein [uncultured Microbacterium sp.]
MAAHPRRHGRTRRLTVGRAHAAPPLAALFLIDAHGAIFWSYLSPTAINPVADGVLDALDRLAQSTASPAPEHTAPELVEYGDCQCPSCGGACSQIKRILERFDDLAGAARGLSGTPDSVLGVQRDDPPRGESASVRRLASGSPARLAGRKGPDTELAQ